LRVILKKIVEWFEIVEMNEFQIFIF